MYTLEQPTNSSSTNPNSVLSGELQNFLYDLDSEYPAQVFAVYRIGVKLVGSTQTTDKTCDSCLRPIEYDYESAADRASVVASKIDDCGDLRIEDLLNPEFDINVVSAVDSMKGLAVCHSCRS